MTLHVLYGMGCKFDRRFDLVLIRGRNAFFWIDTAGKGAEGYPVEVLTASRSGGDIKQFPHAISYQLIHISLLRSWVEILIPRAAGRWLAFRELSYTSKL
jgi:hypothetical protein